jgi:hypothetical protein
MNAEDRSDARIRQGANVLAAALAVFIVLPAIYPVSLALCSVNGVLWATWAQVAAIAGTGVVATVAIRFAARAEKMRNSIRAISEVYDAMSLNENSLTPMDATVLVAKTLRVAARRAEFYHAQAEMQAGRAEPDSFPEYERVSAAIAAINNYFGGLAILLEKGVIDKDLILNRFSTVALRAYHDQDELEIRQPRVEFVRMAQMSYDYLVGLGDKTVKPPQPLT